MPAQPRLEPPLDPGPDRARELLLEELGKDRYRAAEPNWFDRAWRDFFEWLGSLGAPSGGDADWLVPLLVGLLVAALAVLGLVLARRLRLGARSRIDAIGRFDDASDRDAAAMRRAAEAAAAAGDWRLAQLERFRALARSLAERTLIQTAPGLTARALAAQAALAFPEHAAALALSAAGFDDTRYLEGEPGPAEYAELAALDAALLRARPAVTA